MRKIRLSGDKIMQTFKSETK